jgi:hypothetical protein
MIAAAAVSLGLLAATVGLLGVPDGLDGLLSTFSDGGDTTLALPAAPAAIDPAGGSTSDPGGRSPGATPNDGAFLDCALQEQDDEFFAVAAWAAFRGLPAVPPPVVNGSTADGLARDASARLEARPPANDFAWLGRLGVEAHGDSFRLVAPVLWRAAAAGVLPLDGVQAFWNGHVAAQSYLCGLIGNPDLAQELFVVNGPSGPPDDGLAPLDEADPSDAQPDKEPQSPRVVGPEIPGVPRCKGETGVPPSSPPSGVPPEPPTPTNTPETPPMSPPKGDSGGTTRGGDCKCWVPTFDGKDWTDALPDEVRDCTKADVETKNTLVDCRPKEGSVRYATAGGQTTLYGCPRDQAKCAPQALPLKRTVEDAISYWCLTAFLDAKRASCPAKVEAQSKVSTVTECEACQALRLVPGSKTEYRWVIDNCLPKRVGQIDFSGSVECVPVTDRVTKVKTPGKDGISVRNDCGQTKASPEGLCFNSCSVVRLRADKDCEPEETQGVCSIGKPGSRPSNPVGGLTSPDADPAGFLTVPGGGLTADSAG